MNDKERLALLKNVSSVSWRTVSRWIRRMAMIEPTVMRRVAQTKFGDLGTWIERGSGNIKLCGCLVGTTAIQLARRRPSLVCQPDLGCYRQPDSQLLDASEVVGTVVAPQCVDDARDAAEEAGMAAYDLQMDIGQTDAEALIKHEIYRQLRRRREQLQHHST